MQAAPKPINEAARLRSLSEYRILGTKPEKAFDNITRMASEICQSPIALISLVDEKRQWFKSKVGLEASETNRDISFCAHTILDSKPLVVEDVILSSAAAIRSPLASISWKWMPSCCPLGTGVAKGVEAQLTRT